MKDVLGALFALLLDCKWLVVFLVVCALVYAKAANAGTPAEVVQVITHGKAMTVILKDKGSCKDGEHKALGIEDGSFNTGCAILKADGAVSIAWDDGATFELPAPQLRDWRPGIYNGEGFDKNPLDDLRL